MVPGEVTRAAIRAGGGVAAEQIPQAVQAKPDF
jgi:hypothetical protein